jgi:hypothetical protein
MQQLLFSISSNLYQQGGAGAPEGTSAEPNSTPGEDVIDAEFSEDK